MAPVAGQSPTHAQVAPEGPVQAGLTLVVPVLNAAASLTATLTAMAGTPGLVETIVVDGGSTDDTAALAIAAGARVLTAPRGRGPQLRAGVAAATTPWVLVLHADTVLTGEWRTAIAQHTTGPGDRAGYFAFALDDPTPAARRIERLVAWRCRRLALPYGDQGLLIHRGLYDAVGGYRAIPLMEDVDLIRRVGRRRLVRLDAVALTSAIRYRRGGYLRRPLRNLVCLSLYFLGVPPRWIARLYA